jgi:hypothetical protein
MVNGLLADYMVYSKDVASAALNPIACCQSALGLLHLLLNQ